MQLSIDKFPTVDTSSTHNVVVMFYEGSMWTASATVTALSRTGTYTNITISTPPYVRPGAVVDHLGALVSVKVYKTGDTSKVVPLTHGFRYFDTLNPSSIMYHEKYAKLKIMLNQPATFAKPEFSCNDIMGANMLSALGLAIVDTACTGAACNCRSEGLCGSPSQSLRRSL